MEETTKLQQFKRLVSFDPINWDMLVDTDRYLHVIGSPSSPHTFTWVFSKHPPPNTTHQLLSMYRQTIVSNPNILQECLRAGLKFSNVQVIQFIARLDEGRTVFGQTLDEVSQDVPLHRARHIQIASILLQCCPQAVSIQNIEGNLPIHTAIMHFKSPQHIKLLIERGKQQNMLHGGILVPNKNGQTPLSILSHQTATGIDIAYLTFPLFKGDLRLWENLNLLLQEAYSTDHEGTFVHGRHHFRILHSIISTSCPKQAVYLGQLLAPDQIKEADENGRYPLSLAASQKTSCRKEILKTLLNAYPQAILTLDSTKRRLPLHWAVASGRDLEEGTQELLNANPSALEICDRDGFYPCMLAADTCSLNTMYVLLRDCPDVLSRK